MATKLDKTTDLNTDNHNFQGMPANLDTVCCGTEKSLVTMIPLLYMYMQGERGEPHKTKPLQQQNGQWNRNPRSMNASITTV